RRPARRRPPNDRRPVAGVAFALCGGRAGQLPLEAGPSAAQPDEAHKLLALVSSQRPAMQPAVLYWRAVAHTHARQFDQAAADMARLLDPAGYAPHDPHPRSALLPAWQLALRLHPEPP